MRETSLNLLALSYRLVYDTFGCYLTARLAPRHPMRHALGLGALGFVLSSLGAAGAIMQDLGPAWYPILLALSSLPTAWLGGALAPLHVLSPATPRARLSKFVIHRGNIGHELRKQKGH